MAISLSQHADRLHALDTEVVLLPSAAVSPKAFFQQLLLACYLQGTPRNLNGPVGLLLQGISGCIKYPGWPSAVRCSPSRNGLPLTLSAVSPFRGSPLADPFWSYGLACGTPMALVCRLVGRLGCSLGFRATGLSYKCRHMCIQNREKMWYTM